jgi:hypothetical protein
VIDYGLHDKLSSAATTRCVTGEWDLVRTIAYLATLLDGPRSSSNHDGSQPDRTARPTRGA